MTNQQDVSANVASPMASAARRRLYLNTAVFCLVAGVVSLLLLLVLLYGGEGAAQYTVFIVTVEIGLAIVVVASLITIVRKERAARQLAINGVSNKMAVSSCPDYWTYNSSTGVCDNTYTPPSLGGASDEATVTTTFTLPNSKNRTIKPRDLDKKTISTVCQEVGKVPEPWTDLRPTCATFNLVSS